MKAVANAHVGIPALGCEEWSDPLPYQAHALETDARIIVLRWGRGCGKSTILWLYALLEACLYPGMRTLVLAPSYKTFSDGLFVIIQDIDSTFQQLYGYSLIKKWSMSTAINKLTLINGSTFTFRTASRIQDARGGTYGQILLEEGAYIEATEYSWAAFIPVLRGYGNLKILCGGTPAGNTGVLGVLLELGKGDDDVYVSTAATIDNPYFPEVQLKLMRATMSRERWQEEVLGIPTSPSGLVYPEFDRTIHIQPFDAQKRLREPGWQVFEVIDWGYSMAHRLTLAVRQLDLSRPPEIWVIRDIPYDRTDADTICRAVIADFNRFPIPPRAIVTDPEGFSENRTASRIFGRVGRSVVFEKNMQRRSVQNTTEFVRRGLMPASGVPSLHIASDVAALECNLPGGRGMVPSFEHYRLIESQMGTGVFLSKPKDDNKSTHSMDCIRMFYIIMVRFGFQWPIELRPVVQPKRTNQYQ